ncbi:ABC transporter permease, partial [Nocardiopsis tropica]|nr:ABC transporter permease [Nocardiopsis tropica]
MSRIPRPDRTLPAPAAAAVAVVLGVGVTAALDLALLWWAALIIGVAAAFAFVAWSGPLVPDERRAGADGTKEQGTTLHTTLVVPTALVLAVVSGLLSAWFLDLSLIEPVAAALGALVGSAVAFTLFHRLSAMLALSFAAVLAAGVIAIGVTAAVLFFSGISPLPTFARMIEYGTRPNSL